MRLNRSYINKMTDSVNAFLTLVSIKKCSTAEGGPVRRYGGKGRAVRLRLFEELDFSGVEIVAGGDN
jgi:hypothetical protein